MKAEIGAKCWVPFGKRKEAGIILDSAGSDSHAYELVKVELLKINPLVPDQLLRQVYPQPVQLYKLTKRYPSELLPGEESEVSA